VDLSLCDAVEIRRRVLELSMSSEIVTHFEKSCEFAWRRATRNQ
jgi:hypothetical protein